MIRISTSAASYHWKLEPRVNNFRVHDLYHTHSLVSLQWSLQPANASPDWKLSTVPEMEPYKGRGVVPMPDLLKRALPVPTKAFLQPAKTDTGPEMEPLRSTFSCYTIWNHTSIQTHCSIQVTSRQSFFQFNPHPGRRGCGPDYVRIEILALHDYSAYCETKTPQAGTCKAHLLQRGEEWGFTAA